MSRTPAVLALMVLLTSLPAVATPDYTPLTDRQRILHFLNRAGYGPTPSEVDTVEQQGFFFYIDNQLHPDSIDDSAVERRIAHEFPGCRMNVKEARFNYLERNDLDKRTKEHLPLPAMPHDIRGLLDDMVGQKLVRASSSKRQLQEVMVDFWANHFNIDWDKSQDRWLLPTYERDTIRPHALGRFRDLLGATAHSPAMMIYLDNWQSSKPRLSNPKKPTSRVVGGINENYARELMELHTLGVDGGYTQHDVTEVARCFTGWTVGDARDGWPFQFRRDRHDDGAKVVMGVSIPAGGGEQDGELVLDALARHPSTAHFLAIKLCRYFVSDTPPRRLVDQVAAVYLRTDGDIASMVRTILESRDFWSADAYRAKVKNPLFLVASTLRVTDTQVTDTRALQSELAHMGMAPYQCEAPTGYKDTAETWLSSGGLLQRLNFCLALVANKEKGVAIDTSVLQRKLTAEHDTDTVDALLKVLLAGEVSDATRADLETLNAAPNGKTTSTLARMVGLILGSPEFQRR